MHDTPARPAQSDDAQPRVKFLLVDDLEENLLALSALLARDDVEVLTARSGFEALELLLVHNVALAFLDVHMPDMDGFELAELIRGSERTRHVPLIFVTAGSRDQHRMFKGYETGAVDFLYKPIDPHILKSKADVFFELHRQKQLLARELQQRTETLRLSEMFMAVLGHDLRNPLSAIVTSAHVLSHSSSDPLVQKTAARMLSSGKRMSSMIEDLLDLTRARLAGGIVLKRETGDLGAVFDRVVQEHRAAREGREITLAQHGQLTGEWDAERLGQVASNLIGNALKHGVPAKPVEVALDGSCSEAVTFTVSNAGDIPADILPNIFDPFRSARREEGRGNGLGLGLYIVQQIVQAHGGCVDVQSGNGRATFRITVPRKPSAD